MDHSRGIRGLGSQSCKLRSCELNFLAQHLGLRRSEGAHVKSSERFSCDGAQRGSYTPHGIRTDCRAPFVDNLAVCI